MAQEKTFVLQILRLAFQCTILLGISLSPSASKCGELEALSVADISKRVEESCVLVALAPATQDLRRIFRSLLKAFSSEPRVCLAIIRENDAYSQLLRWKDGRNSSLREDLAFYPRKMSDSACLIRVKQIQKAERYRGARNFDVLLGFLNSRCATFRAADGRISQMGLKRERILHHLYTVPNNADLTDKHDAGPINLGANCERVSMPNKEEFFHQYLSRSKPVIITDAMKSWPAMRKWTNRFLEKRFGKNGVRVAFAPNGDYEGCEKASNFDDYKHFNPPQVVKDQLPFPDLVVVRPAFRNMNFSSFMDMVQHPSPNVSAYLEYSSIPSLLPELVKDIKEIPFVLGVMQRKHLNIWLSDGNTLGKLHFDPFDNFLCQVSGKKQVILYEPHDNTRLYEAHIQEATLGYDLKTLRFQRTKLMESTSMVMSPVDILKPNYDRFSKFHEVQAMNCTISEGDVLFMPAFWWHEVQSYPSVQEGRNLAVNFWYEPFLTKEYPCATCKLDINPFYHNLLDGYND